MFINNHTISGWKGTEREARWVQILVLLIHNWVYLLGRIKVFEGINRIGSGLTALKAWYCYLDKQTRWMWWSFQNLWLCLFKCKLSYLRERTILYSFLVHGCRCASSGFFPYVLIPLNTMTSWDNSGGQLRINHCCGAGVTDQANWLRMSDFLPRSRWGLIWLFYDTSCAVKFIQLSILKFPSAMVECELVNPDLKHTHNVAKLFVWWFLEGHLSQKYIGPLAFYNAPSKSEFLS